MLLICFEPRNLRLQVSQSFYRRRAYNFSCDFCEVRRFLENSIRFERNFLVILHVMGNFIKFVWLGCEKHSQNQPKNGQETAAFRLFLTAKTVHTIRTKISSHFLHHSMVLRVQFQ